MTVTASLPLCSSFTESAQARRPSLPPCEHLAWGSHSALTAVTLPLVPEAQRYPNCLSQEAEGMRQGGSASLVSRTPRAPAVPPAVEALTQPLLALGLPLLTFEPRALQERLLSPGLAPAALSAVYPGQAQKGRDTASWGPWQPGNGGAVSVWDSWEPGVWLFPQRPLLCPALYDCFSAYVCLTAFAQCFPLLQ